MGAAQEVLSRAAGWITGKAEERRRPILNGVLCGAVNWEVHGHIGVGRGGKTTKIQADVDGLGNPTHIHLSAGNFHDCRDAEVSLSAVPPDGTLVLTDKAHGSKASAMHRHVRRGLLYPAQDK